MVVLRDFGVNTAPDFAGDVLSPGVTTTYILFNITKHVARQKGG